MARAKAADRTVQVSVSIPKTIKRRAERQAKAQQISFSAFLTRALRKMLDELAIAE